MVIHLPVTHVIGSKSSGILFLNNGDIKMYCAKVFPSHSGNIPSIHFKNFSADLKQGINYRIKKILLIQLW